MTFSFAPRQMGVALPANPYGESPKAPECPPRGLRPGDFIELYVPTVGGDREPVWEHWDRYRVEDVSATDAVTIVALEPTPRFLKFYTIEGLDMENLPETIPDGEDIWRLVYRPGRPPEYQAERGSIMRKSLDKSLQEGTDWRRCQSTAETAA